VNKKKQKNFDNFWPVAFLHGAKRTKGFLLLRPDDEAALAA
jgi:hypothetical protein